VRDGQIVPLKADTRLKPRDNILIQAEPDLHDKLTKAFTGHPAQ
jgi:hypothetical protein